MSFHGFCVCKKESENGGFLMAPLWAHIVLGSVDKAETWP